MKLLPFSTNRVLANHIFFSSLLFQAVDIGTSLVDLKTICLRTFISTIHCVFSRMMLKCKFNNFIQGVMSHSSKSSFLNQSEQGNGLGTPKLVEHLVLFQVDLTSVPQNLSLIKKSSGPSVKSNHSCKKDQFDWTSLTKKIQIQWSLVGCFCWPCEVEAVKSVILSGLTPALGGHRTP